MEAHSKITERYRFRREIGRGAYGSVWAAKEVSTDKDVAIKKIGARNFEETILTKRALRELKLLRHLTGHDNVAHFSDCDLNDYTLNFNELYLVEGLMEADLSQIIKSGQQLTTQHYQYFTYQLLRGLKWLHTANIIHRDLKPGNLLVNSDCELRICDFGLARGLMEEGAHLVNTEYVATRYYRAPEVVLSPKHYTKAIDIWSVGCIFGEMMMGKVMFRGKDYIDQLAKIFEVLGTPQDPTLMSLCSSRVLKYLRTWPKRLPMPWNTVFPHAEPAALDLISKLLVFDPERRLSAEEALAHPFLAPYHFPDDEPSHPKIFDFKFEAANSIPEIKKLILAEVKAFKAGVPFDAEPLSPRRAAAQSNGPSGIDEKSVQNIPRFENQEIPAGATCLEEELQMSGLKLAD